MEERYYYLDSDRTTPKGPHTLQELSDMMLSGELSPATEIAREGDKSWLPLGKQLMESPLLSSPSSVQAPADNLPPVPGTVTAPAKPEQAPGSCPKCGEELRCEGNELPLRCPKCRFYLRPAKDTLWQNMLLALRRPFTLKGRSTRKEYWSTWLLYLLVNIALAPAVGVIWVISMVVVLQGQERGDYDITACLADPIMTVAWIALGVDALLLLYFTILFVCLTVRRMHDVGGSGWWVGLYVLVNMIWQSFYYYDVYTYLAGINWKLLFAIEDAASLDARLHEVEAQINMLMYQGLNGALYLLSSIMGIVLFVITLIDSQRGANAYGPSSKYPKG